MESKMTTENYGRLLVAIVFILVTVLSGWIIHSTGHAHNPADLTVHIFTGIGGLLLIAKVVSMYIKGE